MEYTKIMRNRGTSYFFASILFPEPLKSQVMTLYAFVRFLDDIVDSGENSDQEAKKQLLHYHQQVHKARKGEKVDFQIINDWIAIAHQKKIPLERINSFFDAMIADTEKKNYETYEELQQYMYGSAEVVGLMMLKLIGYHHQDEKKVLEGAKKLAEAMQYSNFLRDIREDLEKYGRIYIPQQELKKQGLSQQTIKDFCKQEVQISDKRKEFMEEQIRKTKILYAEAESTIKYLDKIGQLAVRMSLYMYEAILDRLQSNGYDVFYKKTRTSLIKKVRVFVKILWNDIPLWHRGIWLGLTALFVFGFLSYVLRIESGFRDHPAVTTVMFVTASLPIIIGNKKRREALLFVAVMRGVEWVGHTTQIPFGDYTYQQPWTQWGIANIPIFIAFSWLLIATIASHATKRRRLAMIAIVGLDMLLEPFATMMNYRTWNGEYLLTSPRMNYVSWGIIGGLSYRLVRRRKISRFRSILMYSSLFLYTLARLIRQ